MSDPVSRSCWICRRRPVGVLANANVCFECGESIVVAPADAWRRLSSYLHSGWSETVRRGQFDLAQVFGNAARAGAVNVHLHFLQVLGSQLARQDVALDLQPIAAALLAGSSFPEVSLLIASSDHAAGKLWSYQAAVSVLRDGPAVISAMWTHLEHPVAVKICYMKSGAALRFPPGGHPWHPAKQRRIVKLSPYRGDVEPAVARRDLRV